MEKFACFSVGAGAFQKEAASDARLLGTCSYPFLGDNAGESTNAIADTAAVTAAPTAAAMTDSVVGEGP